jgi:hypothetical protein
MIVPRWVFTPLMRPSSTISDWAGVLAKDLQLAGLLAGVDQLAGNRLRARRDEAGIRIPHAALHHLFLDQRELFLDLGGIDQPHAGSESLAGADLALDLVHPGRRRRHARDLEPADRA